MGVPVVTIGRFLYGKSQVELLLKYALFALVATGVNLGTQHVVDRVIVGRLAVYASLLVGTGAGLLTKYILDKKFIFFFRTTGITQNAGTFLAYAVTGAVTTGIFWGTELSCYYIFSSEGIRYLGGLLGLIAGYTTKYLLDSNLVFRRHG